MFRLVTKMQAPWPVAVEVVSPSGDIEVQRATLIFERIGQQEFNCLFGTDGSPAADNLAIARRVVRGWKDIVDDAGKPLPFTDDALLALLDFPGFPAALGRAYVAFHLASREARDEALGKSPGSGQAGAGSTTATPPIDPR